MATNITTRIALKHATSSDWESSTLTALAGEYLFDSDRKYIKVGDGVHTWSQLQTIRLPKEAIDGLQDVDTNTIYKFENTNGVLNILSADGITTPQVWTNVLSWDLSTLIDGAVEAEATRAKAVEKDLSSAISAHEIAYKALVDAVDAEVNRAKGVEEGLSTTLNTVSSDYLTSVDKAALEARDTFLSGKIDGINTSLSNYALSNDVTAIKTELEGKITAETKRAEGVEEGLDSRLTTAEADIDVLKTGATALSGRMTTAEADIDVLKTGTAALSGRMTTAESDIKAEETRATAAEAALAGRLDKIEGEGEGSIKKALADAKDYANAQDAAVSAVTLAEAKKYTDEKVEDLSVSLSTTVSANYVKYSDVNGGKDALLNENKIATIKDIAGLSGVTHFRGTFVNAESSKTDKQVFFDTYKPVAKGDIAINTSNGKEYLATEDLPLTATSDEISAVIVELGDERLYETKDAAKLKLQEAKEYTDNAIKGLDVDTVTVGAGKTLASISEVDGKIAVVTADIKIAESQVTGLTSDLGTLSSMVETEEAARTAADEALNGKIADEVTARNEAISAAIKTLDVTDTAVEKQFVTAVSETDGKIAVTRSALVSADIPALEYDALGAAAQALADAKDYTDTTISALDVAKVTVGAAKTIASISETDGKIATEAIAIQIDESQVTDLTTDLDTLSANDKYLSDCIEHKVWIKDITNTVLSDGDFTNLSVVKIAKDEYDTLVADKSEMLSGNTLYIVDSDYIDAYGQQLCNLTMSNDSAKSYIGIAATNTYVDEKTSEVQSQLNQVSSTFANVFANISGISLNSQLSDLLSATIEITKILSCFNI